MGGGVDATVCCAAAGLLSRRRMDLRLDLDALAALTRP